MGAEGRPARLLASILVHSRLMLAQVKERDGRCIVTGRQVRLCEAAHIFPYTAGKSHSKKNLDLWTVLRIFYGNEETLRLQELIYGEPGEEVTQKMTLVNRLHNMMTLGLESHLLFGDGEFLLKPLPEEHGPNELRTRVEIVPRMLGPNNVPLDVRPEAFDAVDDFPPITDQNLTLVHNGQDVTITTIDPVRLPLPSRELLDLRVFLVRVLRLAGRSGADMRELVYSSDEEGSVTAEEVEETAGTHPGPQGGSSADAPYPPASAQSPPNCSPSASSHGNCRSSPHAQQPGKLVDEATASNIQAPRTSRALKAREELWSMVKSAAAAVRPRKEKGRRHQADEAAA